MIAPTLDETSTTPNSPSDSPSELLISGILGTQAIEVKPIKKKIQGSAQRARRASALSLVGNWAPWGCGKRANKSLLASHYYQGLPNSKCGLWPPALCWPGRVGGQQANVSRGYGHSRCFKRCLPGCLAEPKAAQGPLVYWLWLERQNSAQKKIK